jgi:hypothetical protein
MFSHTKFRIDIVYTLQTRKHRTTVTASSTHLLRPPRVSFTNLKTHRHIHSPVTPTPGVRSAADMRDLNSPSLGTILFGRCNTCIVVRFKLFDGVLC